MDGDIGTQGDASDNAVHVLITAKLTNADRIDGFTIQNGNANGLSNISFDSENFNRLRGRGVYNINSSPIMTNLAIANNSSDDDGGGMYNSSSSAMMINLAISNNISGDDGGGVYNSSSSPMMINLIISENSSGDDGGGVYNLNSSPMMTNLTISGNNSVENSGGIVNSSFSPMMTNLIISGNNAGDDGGGMYNRASSPIMTNLTISGNNSGDNGGGVHNLSSSSSQITNTVIYGNSSSSGLSVNNTNINSNPSISYSIIEGTGGSGSWDSSIGIDGGNNKDEDPLIVASQMPSSAPTTLGDYRLQCMSPAIDMGDNSVNSTTTDVIGNTRIVNNIIDLGAFESNNMPVTIDGSSELCVGAQTTLSTSDPTPTTNWSSSSTEVATVDGMGEVTGVDEGMAMISYEDSNGDIASHTITVHGLPVISGSSELCVGEQTTLSTMGGAAILKPHNFKNNSSTTNWSSSSTGVATVDGMGEVTGVDEGMAMISYEDSNGCIGTHTINVHGLPVISGSTELCVGEQTTLSTMGGAAILKPHNFKNNSSTTNWSSSSTGVATVDGMGEVTGVDEGMAMISYEDSNGCIGTHTINVHGLPVISGSTELCVGAQTTLSTSDPSPTTNWSSSSTGIATVDGMGEVTGVDEGMAMISYEDSNGCIASHTIAVHGLPMISGSTELCVGEQTTLSTMGGAAILKPHNFKNNSSTTNWSSSSTGVATVDGMGEVTGVDEGMVMISYEDSNGCIGTHTINVHGLPVISGSTELCVGAQTTLSTSDPSPTTNWSSSSTGVATVDEMGEVTGIEEGMAMISYEDSNGCIGTHTINVHGLPVISGSTELCVGAQTRLSTSDPSPTTNWSSSSTGVATVDGMGEVTGVDEGMVMISYEDSNGCIGTHTITIDALPQASPRVRQLPIGLSTNMNASGALPLSFMSNNGNVTVDPSGVVTAIFKGTSIIRVTDGNGCFIEEQFIIGTSPPIDPDIGDPCSCSDPDNSTANGSTVTLFHEVLTFTPAQCFFSIDLEGAYNQDGSIIINGVDVDLESNTVVYRYNNGIESMQSIGVALPSEMSYTPEGSTIQPIFNIVGGTNPTQYGINFWHYDMAGYVGEVEEFTCHPTTHALTGESKFLTISNICRGPCGNEAKNPYSTQSLACNDGLQLSVNSDCGGITADAVIEGMASDQTAYLLTIEGKSSLATGGSGVFMGAIDFSDYIGVGAVKYQLGPYPSAGANTCWGTLQIESTTIPDITGSSVCNDFVSAFENSGSLAPGQMAEIVSAADVATIRSITASATAKVAQIVVNGTAIDISTGTVSQTISGGTSKVACDSATGWCDVTCEYRVSETGGAIKIMAALLDATTMMPFTGTLKAPDTNFGCAYSVSFAGCYRCETWCDGSGAIGNSATDIYTGSDVSLLSKSDIEALLGGACAPEYSGLASQVIDSGDQCGGTRIVNWIATFTIHGKKETRVLLTEGFQLSPIGLTPNIIYPANKVVLDCGDDYSPTAAGAGEIMYRNPHKEGPARCNPLDLHYYVVTGVEQRKIQITPQGSTEPLWVIVPVVEKELRTESYCETTAGGVQAIVNFLKTFPDASTSDGILPSEEIGSLSSALSFEGTPGASGTAAIIAALEAHVADFAAVQGTYVTGGTPYVDEPVAPSYCNVKVIVSDSDALPTCGDGKKIFRTWNIIDWCTGEDETYVQVIEISDKTNPTVIGKPSDQPVTVSISPWTCVVDLDVIAGMVIFSDNCDASVDKTVRIDGHIGSVGVGDYDVIVTGEDDCGNATSETVKVSVVDLVPPVPVCQDEVLATLAADPNVTAAGGVAKVYAEAFNAGSTDAGCGDVYIRVVRMEDWSSVVSDCSGELGYTPVTCAANTAAVQDYSTDSKGNCTVAGSGVGVTALGEFVKFCCEDVGQENMVVVVVMDGKPSGAITHLGQLAAQGINYNTCMVPVTVVDKSSASCTNSSVEIKCTENIDDVVSTPSVNGSACGASFVYQDSEDVDGCGTGSIVRSWFTDSDGSGGFSEGDEYKCRTVVSVVPDGEFDPYSIKWPKHYDGGVMEGVNLECSGDAVTSAAADVAMGSSFTCVPDADLVAPIWCEYNCGLIAYEYEDDTLTASDACLKILRRWTVIDWCKYKANGNGNGDDENDTAGDVFEAVEDWAQGECSGCLEDGKPVASDAVYLRYKEVDKDGYYTYDQVIKVVDDTKPEITAVDTFYVDIVGGSKSAEDTADCVGEGEVSATAEDFCGGAMFSSDALVWTVSRDGGAAKRVVGGTASMGTGEGTDGDQAYIDWVVKDGCGNAATKKTLVIFRDIKAPTPVCIAGLTTAVMPVHGEVAIWARDYDNGSFDNCTSPDDLIFAIVRRGEELDMDAALGGELEGKSLTCDNIGNSNLFAADIYVIDATGNYDFCTVTLLLEDHQGVCDDEGSSVALISGSITNELGDNVEAAKVVVNADLAEYPRTFATTSEGTYAFHDVPMDLDYALSVTKEDDYGSGVNTADLVLIQKQILELSDLNSAYKQIAADANGSGTITTADIIALRKVILGLDQGLANAPAWRFIDASQTLDNAFDYSERITIADLDHNLVAQDFIATKTGDVNVSANTLETRANGVVNLTMDQVEFEAGQSVDVAVRSDNFTEVAGYQLTLAHSGLELVDVQSGSLDLEMNNVGQFAEVLTMSWNNAHTVTTDAVLFTLVFKATQSGSLSESLSVTDKVTVSEAYVGTDLERKGVSLTIGADQAVATGFELYQNEPNPFEDNTVVSFTLPQASAATLTVYDVAGKVIMELVDNYGAGYNEVSLTKAQIQVNGVLYFQLQSGGFTATKKMIVIE